MAQVKEKIDRPESEGRKRDCGTQKTCQCQSRGRGATSKSFIDDKTAAIIGETRQKAIMSDLESENMAVRQGPPTYRVHSTSCTVFTTTII